MHLLDPLAPSTSDRWLGGWGSRASSTGFQPVEAGRRTSPGLENIHIAEQGPAWENEKTTGAGL